VNTDRCPVHSYRQTNFLASLYPATHLGHYALAVRIRQQPDDNRHAGHAAADAPAGAALLIHYPLEGAMQNL